MIGKTILHYRILSTLGEGGMGVVYKAYDTRLDREVAIKCLSGGMVKGPVEMGRFKNEAKAAAALNHQNIAHVYAIEEIDGELLLVMELVEGRDLKAEIAVGTLEPERARSIAVQIAEGLQAAHARGIVHRDIKSSNIMIRTDGLVKIMDFGLAKSSGSSQLTQAGTTVGTTAYMSPEQAHGDEVDHRSDLWSLGVVLYEMLTGRLPFGGEYQHAVTYSIINEEPRPAEGIPADLRQVLSRCLQKTLGSRYQEASEVSNDLKNTNEPPDKTAPAKKKGRTLIVAAAVLAVLTLAVWQVSNVFLAPATSVPEPVAIAVLPFENLNHDESLDYVGDGLTSSLISGLANMNELTVISRTSVMPYREGKKNTQQIARELNVTHVLEGTVIASGDKVRIFAELIDASNGRSVWGETYDRELNDIFAVQTDVADQIASVLELTLGVETRARFEQRSTTDLEAYRFFLKGQYYSNRQTRSDIDTSILLFKRAIERDPEFAQAYVGLGLDYMWLNHFYDPDPLWEEKAYVEIKQALSLDPNLAEAYVAQGMIFWSPGNGFAHEDAIREYRKAVELKPGLSIAYERLALVQLHIGLMDQALVNARKSFELDPGNPWARHFVAQVLLFSGKYREALQEFEKLPDGFNDVLTSAMRALAMHNSGGQEGALALMEESLKKHPSDPQLNSTYAILLAGRQRVDEAGSRIEIALSNARSYTHIHHIYHNISIANALMGRNEEAVGYLVRAAETGFPNFPLFSSDPNFADLRGDPAFISFLEGLRERWEHFQSL